MHRPELLAEDVFIAEHATVVGQVVVKAGASIWFGAVVRGDTERIEIGEGSNIQDLAVLHADPGYPCRIGRDVTVGHGAVIHGATVGDGALIGIRAVVLNGAVIGEGAIVGAGALVPEGREIPARHLAVGMPARALRELSAEEVEKIRQAAEHYRHSAAIYRAKKS
jgi:carbonic anhydrase/acetyltransferase-like protein (isoleucine patch superfamily)